MKKVVFLTMVLWGCVTPYDKDPGFYFDGLSVGGYIGEGSATTNLTGKANHFNRTGWPTGSSNTMSSSTADSEHYGVMGWLNFKWHYPKPDKPKGHTHGKARKNR